MLAPAHVNPKVVQLTVPVELSAVADGKLPSKFKGLAYSGKAVHRGSCVIDVSTTTVPARMAALASHDKSIGDGIVGLVSAASKDGSNINVEGDIYSDMAGSPAEKIGQLAARGFPFQMSVGVYDFNEEWVPHGNSVNVNGQDFSGPLCVLRNGKVREVSICVLGADGDTSAKFFNQPDDTPGNLTEKTDMNDLEQARADLAVATATIATEKARADKAVADLKASTDASAAVQLAARTAAVDALFAEIGEKPADAEKAEFVAMGDAAFAAAAARMRAVVAKAKKADPKLFSEQAVGDASGEGQGSGKKVELNSASIYAKRAAQALKTAA